MHHKLPATPSTVCWGFLDSKIVPVLRIDDGDLVDVETVSGGAKSLPEPASPHKRLNDHLAIIEALRPELGPHILTGPIHVEGAEPGDRLIVRILSIDLRQNWGWNAVEPGFGIFPNLVESLKIITIPIDTDSRTATMPWSSQVPLAPFFGILAVAPDPSLGRVTSVVPGPFGGNIDNKFCCAGAEVHFPVFCKGALFSVGDGHALQGDGEICDTALETALSGRLEFHVEKGTAPPAPAIYTDDCLITMAFDEDLNVGAIEAARRMMVLLVEKFGLDREEAYRHCSLFADLRITQMVNQKKGVHCIVKRQSLSQRP